MGRMIDADALRDALGITGTADSCKGCKYNDRFEFACNTDAAPTFEYVCEMIDDAPTIEERKTGKWIRETKHYKDSEQEFYYYEERCSECGTKRKIGWAEVRYCPNCGAKMEGEQNVCNQK